MLFKNILRMSWQCPAGYIVREGYYRKGYTREDGTRVKGTYVPPSCIKDKGAKGKGPKVMPALKQGKLTRYSYHLKDPVDQRRSSLEVAIKRDGALKTFHRVHALYVLNKRTHPTYSAKAKTDAAWISKNFLGKK